MSEPIIRVENLGKSYRIGSKQTLPKSPFGRVKNALGAPFNYLGSVLRAPTEDELIWALKDISFEIKPGEVVGLIGHNGAGKSTLLKLLSRITKPTAGYAEILGRVASLLEVGTGFHPELTGRENVYLNGSILGMSKQEIDKKFNEIVDFSGVQKFIDTPVKRYSSGMKVRLAFSVAAYLEPEVLIVDEVLSVGDIEFQKRCMGRMQEISKEGRTILFVSHNLGAVQRLCNRVILLEKGGILEDGKPENVIGTYYNQEKIFSAPILGPFSTWNPAVQIIKINVEDIISHRRFSSNRSLSIELETSESIRSLSIDVQVWSIESFARLATGRVEIGTISAGFSNFYFEIEDLRVAPGQYLFSFGMSSGETGLFYKQSLCELNVSDIGVSDEFIASRGSKLGTVLKCRASHDQDIAADSGLITNKNWASGVST